jgi:hypothetical protein
MWISSYSDWIFHGHPAEFCALLRFVVAKGFRQAMRQVQATARCQKNIQPSARGQFLKNRPNVSPQNRPFTSEAGRDM